MEIQYTREDVDFETWYSDWMKNLAKAYTQPELEKMLSKTGKALTNAAQSHLRAIKKSTSMTSNARHRGQTRNVVAANSQFVSALRGALEIYKLFPEETKGATHG